MAQEKPIPTKKLVQLQKQLQLSNSEMAHALGVSPRSYAARIQGENLGADTTARYEAILELFDLATNIFSGDRAAARSWLTTPNRSLGDQAPCTLTGTPVGIERVGNTLQRIKHGMFA